MTMFLIQNSNTQQYIKQQPTTTLDTKHLSYTDNIIDAQIYESSDEASVNAQMLNLLTSSDYYSVKQPFETYKDEAEYFEGNNDINTYLKWYKHDINRYPRPSVTVDLIALRFNQVNNCLQIMLVKRRHWPYKDMWAMPGGFVDKDETINHAVIRETLEETHVDLSSEIIIRMPAVSKAHRDPRTWVITNPNIVLLRPDSKIQARAGDDAGEVNWFNIRLENNQLRVEDDVALAFDHADIIRRALLNLKSDFKSGNLPRVTTLLNKKLTLNQLKALYGQIDERYLNMNNSNLYRLYRKCFIQTDEYTKGEVGRPERLYIYKDKWLKPDLF